MRWRFTLRRARRGALEAGVPCTWSSGLRRGLGVLGSMIAFVHLSSSSSDPTRVDRACVRISRVVRWLAREGVDGVILAVGDELAERCETILDGGPAIRVIAAPEPGSVATSLRDVAESLGEGGFLVVDAARFEDFDLAALVAEHASSPAIATLALRRGTRSVAGRRVDIDRAGRILRIATGSADADLEFETVGTCVVERELLRHVPASGAYGLEEDLLPLVVRSGGILSGLCVVDDEPAGAAPAGLGARR